MSTRAAVAVVIAAVTVVALLGCGNDRPHPAASGPPCLPTVTAGSAGGVSQTGAAMPDVALPCFVGGRRTDLRQLRGPAIVNLWASSCAPCRTELPELARYADRAAGRIGLLGVVTADRRAAAQSVITDLGLTFGMLEDRDGTLLRSLGRTTLPVTLLVAADGSIAYTHVGVALDEAALDALVRRYLGVAVPA